MLFVFSVILAFFLTIPGVYLILRARLASSLIELLASGFFFGFSLVVLAYLGLSRCFPVYVVDSLVILLCAACAWLVVTELRRDSLPVWMVPFDRMQASLVALCFVFMTLLAFGDLAKYVDDDVFIHLPNIKRVAMGDIPPHMPYFPQTYLRGHTGRDLFTGTVARLLDLEPELAVIYVTLAVCPAVILMFFSFAWRMGAGDRAKTCFCFVGSLFLVSFSVGAQLDVRAGPITYVWNNNIFVWGHAVFMAWLIYRSMSSFAMSSEGGIAAIIGKEKLIIAIDALAYAGLYFVYISNFVLFSLYLVALPFLLGLWQNNRRLRSFLQSAVVIGVIVVSALLLHILISPFVWERILISLHLQQSAEPSGFTQQTLLTFPKEHLFTITDPVGDDIPVFRRKFLLGQGLSFYAGLGALIFGFWRRNLPLAATSLFGWITMVWLLTVDMGEMRAETVRLLLIAHMAFGASTGLMMGWIVNRSIDWLQKHRTVGTGNFSVGLCKAVAVYSAAAVFVWMGWGNAEKFIRAKHWRIAHNARKIAAIHGKDPENWHPWLNMRHIDADTLRVLSGLIGNTHQNVLLKMEPDARFKGDGHWANKMALLINAASMTGAGVVGLCQEHCKPRMGRDIYAYGYVSGLFWLDPTADLLQQLSPDWIVLDPALVSTDVLNRMLSLKGVKIVRTIDDGKGQRRLILSCVRSHLPTCSPGSIDAVSPEVRVLCTRPFQLCKVAATVKSSSPSDKIALFIADDEGQQINTMDVPAIGKKKLGADRYELAFSMVQPGSWNVYFVDPADSRRLNSKPLKVNVSE